MLTESRNVLHLAYEPFKSVFGRATIHLAQDHEAGLALGEHADGGAVVGALDEVTFPVPPSGRIVVASSDSLL